MQGFERVRAKRVSVRMLAVKVEELGEPQVEEFIFKNRTFSICEIDI